MAQTEKDVLDRRIRDNQRKIEEMAAFQDDPKFAKIIRTLQKQIAQDTYELSMIADKKR